MPHGYKLLRRITVFAAAAGVSLFLLLRSLSDTQATPELVQESAAGSSLAPTAESQSLSRPTSKPSATTPSATTVPTRTPQVAAAPPQSPQPSTGATAMTHQTELHLFDFDRPKDIQQWFAIDDNVMGGVSSSRMEDSGRGTALFTGKVSLERNGGFASVRSRASKRDVTGFDGLLLRVRGDGKRYNVTLQSDASRWLYQATLESEAIGWSVARVPFSAFRATDRGRIVRGAPAINPGGLTSVGFLIADKQAGPFTLEVDWIGVYQEP